VGSLYGVDKVESCHGFPLEELVSSLKKINNNNNNNNNNANSK
jgi:hypothetical protein